jgi:hypothetical protein
LQDRVEVPAIGLQVDPVGMGLPAQFFERGFPGNRPRQKRFAESWRSGVNDLRATGFGILQSNQADIRPTPFAGIGHVDGNGIVPTGRTAKQVFGKRAEKVTEKKHDRPAAMNSVQIIEGDREIGRLSFRLKKKNIAEQAENMPAAFTGRYVPFNAIRVSQEADAVVIPGGADREHGGGFGNNGPLRLFARAEPHARRGIDDEHDRQLAFFNVPFHKRGVHPGRYVPINPANVVARLIGPDVFEGQACAFKRRMVFPAEGGLHDSPRSQVKSANLA